MCTVSAHRSAENAVPAIELVGVVVGQSGRLDRGVLALVMSIPELGHRSVPGDTGATP